MTSKGWSVHDEWLYPCHQHVYAPITRRVADLCHQHVYAPITWRVVVPVLPACLRPYYMASGCTCATSMETPLLHDEWLYLCHQHVYAGSIDGVGEGECSEGERHRDACDGHTCHRDVTMHVHVVRQHVSIGTALVWHQH